MDQLLQKVSQKSCKASVPEIRPGYQVRVHQKIKEGNKERIQVFQGMVIRTGAGEGVGETFTVRKVSEGIGVEKVFPIHAPSIVKIEVQRAHKVRRSKLNFLKKLSGKALRLKEIDFTLEEKKYNVPQEEPASEEVSEQNDSAVESKEKATEKTEEKVQESSEAKPEKKEETESKKEAELKKEPAKEEEVKKEETASEEKEEEKKKES
ncbi:50S ribosomal protein L19 [Candidatus Gracilibacteria bacterium]|nr:50S ribosomal protein L19 [Candidatus Gracilibacteria bacterium]MCF7819434.1 50S ribosomal protein L19 [Candidatus Gracilibacteria bacterium]